MTVATAPSGRPRALAPPALLAGFVLFLGAIAWLIASSLATRRVATFAPTASVPSGVTGTMAAEPSGAGIVDTLTIAAADEHAWRRIDLARGAVLAPGERGAWDLAVRRYHLVPALAAADLGPLPVTAAGTPPHASFVATTFAAETTNAALQRWYRYGMLTHLLTPKGHTYVVRGHGGREFMLEVLSYYCPGPTAGCMTIRYASIPAASLPTRRVPD